MAIQTIIFDFGNVLAHFSHLKAATQLASYGPPGLNPQEVVNFVFEQDLEQRFEVAEVSGAEVLQLLRQRFGLRGSDEELALACGDMFTGNPATLEMVPGLSQRHRLLLLSNTNELHYRRFRTQFAPALDLFHHLIVSHEVRLRKPNPAIYRHAQDVARCRPEEVVFIDDLATNIEAGRAAGWHAIQYTPRTDLRAELSRLGVEAS
jgi:putative hydrolase of the HAD superfamily